MQNIEVGAAKMAQNTAISHHSTTALYCLFISYQYNISSLGNSYTHQLKFVVVEKSEF